MIQEFTVKNFLSIRDSQTVSFVASSDDTSEELLTYEINGTKLLKMIFIYGANASGKTNILCAIESIWRIMFEPYPTKDYKIGVYQPFALSKDEPTEFDMTFYVNGIKYRYSVEFDRDKILYERMEYSPKGVASKFYERHYSEEKQMPVITFGSTLSLSGKDKGYITANTLNNHSVLSTYGKVSVDSPEFKVLYDFIKDHVHDIYENTPITEIVEKLSSDGKEKGILLYALKKADLNIEDIHLAERENNLPSDIVDQIEHDKDLPDSIKKRLLQKKVQTVEFVHRTEEGTFALDERVESSGTITYINILHKLCCNIEECDIYLMDEIESDLHYDLLLHFLSVFMFNTKCSQMIMTTHDQMLLDEDWVRRDMVWFTEKNRSTASTEVYSAKEFGLHKNVSLYNAYKIGKLGAKPEVGSPFLKL